MPLFERRDSFERARQEAFATLVSLERQRKAGHLTFDEFAERYAQVTDLYPSEDPATTGQFGPQTEAVQRLVVALGNLRREQWAQIARLAENWRSNPANMLRTAPVGMEVITPGQMQRARLGIAVELETSVSGIASRAGERRSRPPDAGKSDGVASQPGSSYGFRGSGRIRDVWCGGQPSIRWLITPAIRRISVWKDRRCGTAVPGGGRRWPALRRGRGVRRGCVR